MQPTPAAIVVESPSLRAGEPIPAVFTADGRNISPALTWRGLPDGTRELALLFEDPDAPTPQPFVHWILYKIPATAAGVPEGVPIDPEAPMPPGMGAAVQGTNGFRRPIYRGPAPPPGKVHHYRFILFALDTALDVGPGLTKAELLEAMEGHVIGRGELVATYERIRK
ncbi:MAG: YbhB/YbcL family Raf kinase inhibitor-like protein [Acidobacteriota bacterium]